MTINKKGKTNNFSISQLKYFLKELEDVKRFNELMFRKGALIQKNGSTFIVINDNIQEYKEKYLTDEYESLRSIYKTKIPYTFWCKLYIELRNRKNADISL
jgi:hypothetical protein